MFFLWISIIFCMRETVFISNGSSILPCSLGFQNDLKNKIYFWTFFRKLFFEIFLRVQGVIFWGATVGL